MDDFNEIINTLTEEEKEIDSVLRKFIETQNFTSQEAHWEIFSKQYYPLILKIAKRVFKDKNFDLLDQDDIFQEAYYSYICFLKYHNPEKRTKQTTSYIWMFKKRLKDLSRKTIACYTDKNYKNVSRYSENSEVDFTTFLTADFSFSHDNESFLDKEEEFMYSTDLEVNDKINDYNSIKDDSHNQIREEKRGSRYLVCTESFLNHIDSLTYKCLSAISNTGDSSDRRCFNISKSRFASSRSFIKAIRKNIKESLASKKIKLYQAVCLNGSRNIVYVAGKNVSEAKKFLKPYGTLLEIHDLFIE